MALIVDGSITDVIGGINLVNIANEIIGGVSGSVFWQKIVFTFQEFAYTGAVQEFVAPVTGTYKLEVWGAQGGGTTLASGGKGGYSYGNVELSAGQVIYIVVGGQGGYNGGGAAGGTSGGNGGGATHIAKTTNRGILSSYASNTSEVLIVAGGGGGGAYYSGQHIDGATGGGTAGGNGSCGLSGNWDDTSPTGGTQTSGGTRGKLKDPDGDNSTRYGTDGSFGTGGAGNGSYSGGGGAGWYGGGGAATRAGAWMSGAGGSGYIGGVSDGAMSNGIQSGNGTAKITLIGNDPVTQEMFIFNNGISRSGDTWRRVWSFNNDDSDEGAYSSQSCGNRMYASAGCGNWDRFRVTGGMLTQAIDISNYNTLNVTISGATIENTGNSGWYVGVRNSLLADTNSKSIPWISGCTLISKATAAGTYSLDLSTYKSTYGNTAYFLYGAGKVSGTHPNGGASVTIEKVWFSN